MLLSFGKSSNIYETFAPLYKTLKAIGIIPFHFNIKTGKICVKYPLDFLWMVIMWLFWTSLIGSNLYFGAREPGEDSTIISHGWHWNLILNIFGSFFVQILNLFSRKMIEKLLRILHQFDEMVNNSRNENLRHYSLCSFVGENYAIQN